MDEKYYKILDKALLLIGIIIGIVLITIFITPLFYPVVPSDNSSITKAFNDGIIISMVQLLESTDQCKIASIQYFNTTRRLVDLDCVRAVLQQQNITLGD